MKTHSTSIRLALFLLITVLFIYAIIVARNFLYPIVFGALFSYLLFPIVNFLEKNKFPRILAIIFAILLALSIIGGIFMLFFQQFSNMFDDLNALKKSANNNIESLQTNLENFLGLANDRIEIFLKDQVNQIFSSENISKIFSATTGTIVRILILPVYVFLFLFYRTKFAYFILKIVESENKENAINILRDISTVAARYMGGVSIVVLILCIINSTGLLIIGVEYAILLGIISAFFNFIPYFGTLMGGSVPFLFVLLTTDEPLYFGIRVALFFIVVQFTENNILTPNIVGGNVKINPFFIIIGLVAGATVWGIPGMLVIVPFLAVARIIFMNVESLQPYAFLIGPRGTQKHSLRLRKLRSFLNSLIKKNK